MSAIGFFGGTFDPVHIGHLRTAVELRQLLELGEMRLLPAACPPHRDQPLVAAEHRLAMLREAIAGEPGLVADDRELRRHGPSYTIDTLRGLRAELGDNATLYLCLGMDSLVQLTRWRHWRELTDVAHLVVAARPGWRLPQTGEVAAWMASRLTRDRARLRETTRGRILVVEMTLLPVAATAIRADLAAGRSVRYLVPDPVLDYIRRHRLYSQPIPPEMPCRLP